MSERFFESYLSQFRERKVERETGEIAQEESHLIEIAENVRREAVELEVEKIQEEFLKQEEGTLRPVGEELKPEKEDTRSRFRKILDRTTAFCALSVFAFGLSQGLFAREARAEDRLIPEKKIELREKEEGRVLYEKLEKEFYQSVEEGRGFSEYVPYSKNKEAKKWHIDQMLKIIGEKGAVPAKIEYLGGHQVQFFYNQEGEIKEMIYKTHHRGSAYGGGSKEGGILPYKEGILKSPLILEETLREKYNDKLEQGIPADELEDPSKTFKKVEAWAKEIDHYKEIISDLEKAGRVQEISFIKKLIEERIQKIIELTGEEVLEEGILESRNW